MIHKGGRLRIDRDRLEARLPKLLARHRTAAVSIAVIANFEVAWAHAWGVTDARSGASVSSSTVFQAASLSKSVAAMVALKAAQDGQLDLDADINDVLKSWKLPMPAWAVGTKVTPRMLLSHTSGLGDGFGFPGYEPGAALPTLLQVLDGQPPSPLPPVRLAERPGSACAYSGGGTTLLQLALEDIFRQPFAILAQTAVLEPLGMHRSTFEQPLAPLLWPTAARAHDTAGKVRETPWRVYPEIAAAGLWSTPAELARFLTEVQRSLAGSSGQILDAAMAREMITPVPPGQYGLGFAVPPERPGWFGHTGSNWGYRCEMWAHAESGAGAVIMTNADSGDALIRALYAIS